MLGVRTARARESPCAGRPQILPGALRGGRGNDGLDQDGHGHENGRGTAEPAFGRAQSQPGFDEFQCGDAELHGGASGGQ